MLGRRPDSPSDRVETIFGKDTEFRGSLVSTGMVRIEGRFEGEIQHRGDIIILETAHIVATKISARNVTIAGHVRGNITAEGKLEIVPTGRLFGDIKVGQLIIADGAVFQGTAQMSTGNNSTSAVLNPSEPSKAS